tara:strand:+ start:4297 stop:5196 length:900 start_codon:yes stop_codon:yes gene_type:complete
MPELPDLTIYQEAIEARLVGESLIGIRILNPFVLRTVSPEVTAFAGCRFTGTRRIGKRIVLCFQPAQGASLFAVVHLMLAGRFQWYQSGSKIPHRLGLMGFDFPGGTLGLTEASQKHRAALHLVQGENALAEFNLGGLELKDATLPSFKASLSQENHTLKRSMTDQRFLAGIGNAYSDEILHRAKISPMRQIKYLSDDQWQSLFEACLTVISEWTNRLREKTGESFPKKVTAFQPEMAVHGKFKQPCPDCGNPVQRIRYATNECNYCAACQNQGNLLADRSLSRLLKKDWPKTLEELDQ